MKYGKLRIKDGHIISSKWISKDKIKNRNNYSVAVSINYLNLILLKKFIFYIRLILLLIKIRFWNIYIGVRWLLNFLLSVVCKGIL